MYESLARVCLTSLFWDQYRSYQICFISFKTWMNSATMILLLKIFTFWCSCESKSFQTKMSWFFSLSMTDFSYQMTVCMWLMSSCRFWASSIIYFVIYNLSRTFDKFILNCLISLSHHIWTSLSCCIMIFMTLLSLYIYHYRVILCKQLNRLILTRLSFQSSVTFCIQSQNRWMFCMRVFFSLKITSSSS